MKYVALLLLFSVLLTPLPGCATTEISHQKAESVPSDRVYEVDLLEPEGSRTVAVTITRDTGLTGAALKIVFKIDGKRIGKFKTGETLTIYLERGRYSFGIISERTILGVVTPLEEIDVNIKEGGINKFRIMTQPYSHPKLSRASL